MANTTNFNWETPDDTDLVKDGAAAIRTLGSAIDTSLVDLKGGTTGQVLSKATGTDMDFTWVAQDDSNAIQNAIVDAKGDLISATANDTPARLAVGTNGQVLTADSAESTGLKWATPITNSMTLISTTTLSSGTTTLSSIPGTYNKLHLIIRNFKPATDAASIRMRFNSDAGTNYEYAFYGRGTNITTSASGIIVASANDNSVATGLSAITIYDYANATTWKICDVWSVSTNETTTTRFNYDTGLGTWVNTSAITSIDLQCTSGNYTSGTVLLYGVK